METAHTIDNVLLSYGYDPERVGVVSKALAQVCLENQKLKDRIAELQQQLASVRADRDGLEKELLSHSGIVIEN